METVSKLVDAGYKAIWGDVDTRTEVQHDERRQSEDQSKKTSGVASTPSIKVIDAGEQSLWPGTSNMNIPHAEGEEPVSGVTGKGTSTDPYDAGNRDGMSHIGISIISCSELISPLHILNFTMDNG